MNKIFINILFVLLFCISVFPQTKSLADAQTEIQTFANSQNFSIVYDQSRYVTKAEVGFDILEPNTSLAKQFKEFELKISTLFALKGIDQKPVRTRFCINTRSKKFYFSSNRSLTLTLDSEAITLGEADRSTEIKGRKARENLCWEIDIEIIKDLGKTSKLEYKVGKIKGEIPLAKLQYFRDYAKLLKVEDKHQ